VYTGVSMYDQYDAYSKRDNCDLLSGVEVFTTEPTAPTAAPAMNQTFTREQHGTRVHVFYRG
jgi:hypothetical protein